MNPDTRLLREGTEPEYARLRVLLAERGLDPDTVALATLFPDDVAQLFGIVVTPEGRVFEFDLDYLDPETRTGRIANGVLCRWEETSVDSPDLNWDDEVREALAFLGVSEERSAAVSRVPDLGAFVRDYLDRVVNRHEVAAVERLVAPDYRGGGHGWPATRDDLRAFYAEQARNRPDWRIDVQETVQVGDSVVVRAHAGGTVMAGGFPAQRRVEWLANYRVTDRTIREITVLALLDRE